MRPSRAWLPILAALLTLAPAAAQERPELEGHAFLPEARWGRLAEADLGKRFYLEGRWQGVFGSKVNLYRSPEAARDFLSVPEGSPLQVRLAAGKDSRGEALQEKRSRVRLFGQSEAAGGRVVIKVERAFRLPDDEETLRQRLASIQDDAAALQGLAQEARDLAVRYDDAALGALADEVVQRELRIRRAALRPGDHQGAVQLGRRMLEVGDKRGAVQLFAAVERQGPPPLRQQMRTALERLGAVEVKDGWELYDDYKRSEGFVQVTGSDGSTRWVRRELAELEQVVAEESRLQSGTEVVLVRTNPREHLRDAEAGRVVRGQTMPEVRLAAGLPREVFHERGTSPGPNARGSLWSIWVLSDGRRVYFLDGEVVRVILARQPWPGQTE